MLELITPRLEHLPAYVAALREGWSPDNVRLAKAAQEELRKIDEDPEAFIAGMTDLEAKGDPITLPDGQAVPRLPGFRRWLWDDGFCGSFGFRWQPGSSVLPPHCLGHIGYSIVSWRRQQGYATEGLRLLLEHIRGLNLADLDYVELTTDPDNVPSQKVITANRGVLIETFQKPAAYGNLMALRFRISMPLHKM